jgi:hypothetical protein
LIGIALKGDKDKEGLRPTILDPGTRGSANLGHPYSFLATSAVSSVVSAPNSMGHLPMSTIKKHGSVDPSELTVETVVESNTEL